MRFASLTAFALGFLACATSTSNDVEPPDGSTAESDAGPTDSSVEDAGPSQTAFTPDSGICPEGWFRYDDPTAGLTPPDASPLPPEQAGDLKCHRYCGTDAECGVGMGCRTLGLFKGGDFNCNGRVLVCRPAAADSDCTAFPDYADAAARR